MRLLFDQNLSYKLSDRIAHAFPGAAHIRDFGLATANDWDIWEFAKASGWVLVSKDGDFHQMSLLYGPPPQLVWIRAGNASTAQIAHIILDRQAELRSFAAGTGALLLL